MILVTSANGRTARYVIPALLANGLTVRTLDRSEQVAWLKELGVQEIVVGDMLDTAILKRALDGVEAVFHIGPAFHSKETAIGQAVIDAARSQNVNHFVYASAIHPQIDALLNHKAKLLVEDYLLRSRLPYTILQPMHYMQNISIVNTVKEGMLNLPYALEASLSFVNLADVAEVAAKVLTEKDHHFSATYELCGSDFLNGFDIVDIISRQSGKKIETRRIPIEVFVEKHPYAKKRGEHAIDSLYRLVIYYNRYGISGNPNVLTWLLGRAPTTFADYVKRELQK